MFFIAFLTSLILKAIKCLPRQQSIYSLHDALCNNKKQLLKQVYYLLATPKYRH
jgi:hypothetical protein